MSAGRSGIAEEAARIVCEELLTDYRMAKQKALERLGLPPRTALPDNAQIQRAVIEYQQVFGGEPYRTHLRQMRESAIQALRLLAPFSPRLVGAAVSGAVTTAHRVQIHAFSDQPELVDVFLIERRIAFDQDERHYRYPDGSERAVGLVCFEGRGPGIDVAVFPEGEQRYVPINPADGQAYKRLDLAAVQKLLDTA